MGPRGAARRGQCILWRRFFTNKEAFVMGYLILIFVAVPVIIFAVQNAAVVTVSFLFWNFGASLSVIILGSFVIGAAAVFVSSLIKKLASPIGGR